MKHRFSVSTKPAAAHVNILCLWGTADAKGYSSGIWGTYRQWAEIGAQVRKGEKAAFVVLWKELRYEGETDRDTGEVGTRLLARATPVFAAEQVDGYVSSKQETPPTTLQPVDRAEAFALATGATIIHGGDRAYYRPSTDSIYLPESGRFIGSPTSTPEESYYATLLHELTHWTSHEKRCNRQLGRRFRDNAYAMEELVAELGAAFLCADLGISDAPRTDHARYLGKWLTVLKSDKKAIFTAASKASEAIAFLETFQGTSAAVPTIKKATPKNATL